MADFEWLDFLPSEKKKFLSTLELFKKFERYEITRDDFLQKLNETKLGEHLVAMGALSDAKLELLWDKVYQRPQVKIIAVHESPITLWRKEWYRHGKMSHRKWIDKKEIRVFRMPDVKKRVGEAAIEGLSSLIDELALNVVMHWYIFGRGWKQKPEKNFLKIHGNNFSNHLLK